jgi:hypothetical protein
VIDLVQQHRLRFARGFQIGGALLDLPLHLALLAVYVALRLNPVGDIELRREEIADPAVAIMDRAQIKRIPKGRTVLAVDEQIDCNIAACGDRFPDPANVVAIGVRALEETAVPTDDLVASVAAQPLEGDVAKDDRIVRLVGIGDHHRHPRRANGRSERIARARLVLDVVREMPVVALFHVCSLERHDHRALPWSRAKLRRGPTFLIWVSVWTCR